MKMTSQPLTREWITAENYDGTKTRLRLGEQNDLYVDFEIMGDDDEMEISGSVKWDGCMNWETSPACMYHCCGPEGVKDLAQKLTAIWPLAKPLMPKADEGYGR